MKTEDQARAAGFTRELTIHGPADSLRVLVKPDTDLDGRFPAFCLDELERISVAGWLIEEIDPVVEIDR